MASATEGYAKAIFEVARAEGVLERVEDELYRLARTVEGNAELRERLTAPGGDLGTKLGVVEDLLEGRAHPQTVSAVVYVVAAGRARELGAIADAVVALAAEARRHVVAEVRSAVALDERQQQRLAEALGRSLDKHVDVKVTVDADVIGGMVVKLGDTVIDGSVARRLAELRARLVGA